jgi:hypothetical protein
MMRTLRVAMLALLVVPLSVGAQSERVTIRLAPSPNQSFHMRLLQEINVDVEAADSASTTPVPPTKLALTISMVSSMAVGAADDQGRLDVRMKYDEAKMDARLNDQPAPFPDMLGALEGRELTLTYDRDGRVLDLRSDTPSSIVDAIKPMMSGLLGAGGVMVLAVGETLARPFAVPLPIPGAGPGGGLKTEMRYTLQSISGDAGARIAHLTTALVGDMQPPAATGAPTANGFHLTGEGTLDVDLERGIIKVGEQRMTMDGELGAGRAAGVPPMRMHGTMRLSQTSQ